MRIVGFRRFRAVCGVLTCLIAAAVQAAGVDVRAIADEKSGADWLSYGRTYSEAHYSPLTAITARNVSQLGLEWALDLPGEGTLEGIPLAVGGILYFSGSMGKTYAVDARKGRQLWVFDPDFAHNAPQRLRMNMGAHRGIAFWQDKVYVGVSDGRLIALDANTGKPVWSVQTFDEYNKHKVITSAPRVFNGKVIIGHGGADFGTRGYVTAYDAQTGRKLWRFYTVPGDPRKGFENAAMAMAAKTWNGHWYHWGGGGTVWDNITYDPDLNQIYLGVGNGDPWDAQTRSPGTGDNLFLCSIVALNADTGQYVWHYQLNPRESWDYKTTANMIMADLKIDTAVRKVLMQAPVNGFFYVLDRVTGKVISAQKFAKVTWADHIDLETGRPVEADNIRYDKGPVTFWPSAAGAHSWQPMAFNTATGLVYIPTMKLGMRTSKADNRDDLNDYENPHHDYFLVMGNKMELVISDPDDGTAGLLAWDPVAQKKRWEVHYPDSLWNGGVMSTAGDLVFQGTARGDFIAYEARTGQRLWSFHAGLGIVGSAITYTADNVQYVSILVGYGGAAARIAKEIDYGWRFGEQPRRLLTFALGGTQTLPPTSPPRFTVHAVDDPKIVIDPAQASEGRKLYHATCVECHGIEVESVGSFAPDLRESSTAQDWQSFRTILHEGTLAGAGMPKYDDFTEADLRAVYMYVRERARAAARHGS